MLKLHVGVAKKVGRPHYGSEGANFNLELELNGGLAADAERLHARARELFALAEAAVDEQLRPELPLEPAPTAAEQPAASRNRRPPRRATGRQLRALELLAERRAIDLAALAAERYAVSEPAALSITQASDLIGSLQEASESSAETLPD